MLLLVVNENKMAYDVCLCEKVLHPKKIVTVTSFKDAIDVIKKFSDKKDISFIINFVYVDNILEPFSEFIDLCEKFNVKDEIHKDGIIVLKVAPHHEYQALELMKRGLITEYFVDSGNEKEDEETFKKVFSCAIAKKNFNTISRQFENNLKKWIA